VALTAAPSDRRPTAGKLEPACTAGDNADRIEHRTKGPTPATEKGTAMPPWVESPALDIDLDRPAAHRYADMPQDAIDMGRQLLDAIMAEIPDTARLLADAVRLRTGNRFHADTQALADLVARDWRSVILANISYDLAMLTVGCSTIALPTSDGPVLARNMDWFPEVILARTSYLLRFQQRGELEFVIAGWPGSIGVVTGLSARGFAVALNAAFHASDGTDKLGYPVLLFLRRILEEARDFDHAVRMLTRQRLASPGLFTLVGSRNDQRVVIERTPRRHALRRPVDGGPLFATNHYRQIDDRLEPCQNSLPESSCPRYEALERRFAAHAPDGALDDDALLRTLTDPEVIQEITAQHIVMRPRDKTAGMWVPDRLIQKKRG